MKGKNSSKIKEAVDVVVPTYNSATTIIHTLETLIEQHYPINKIIVVDNNSTDNTVLLVEKFKQLSPFEITIIRNKKNMGVGYSYNLGEKKTSTPLVVFMHSDSSLPSNKELNKLIEPFYKQKNVVATYPTAVLPEEIWDQYNFWQKCRFARSVGIEIGFNAKFDCLDRRYFRKCGGFDEKNFALDEAIGGEDADLYLRLSQYGHIVLSNARVTHLHYLGKDYSLDDWIKNRKMLARTYGRLIRFKGHLLPLATSGFASKLPLGSLLFFIKPLLALMPLIPGFQSFGIIGLLIYAWVASKRMYTTFSTLLDVRIVALPFIDIFLVYYESFWMLETLLFSKRRVS